jgi:hypothetical protein
MSIRKEASGRRTVQIEVEVAGRPEKVWQAIGIIVGFLSLGFHLIGRQFRVGYYSRQGGLDCIWLVNEKGEYEQTTDRDGLLRYFAVEKLTDERDYYGVHKRKLGPLRSKRGVDLQRNVETSRLTNQREASLGEVPGRSWCSRLWLLKC